MYLVAGKQVDELDDWPSLTPVFSTFTARELDTFLTMMEAGITLPETPAIIQDDLASLHGDALMAYSAKIKCGDTDRAGWCLVCGVKHVNG